MAMKGAAPVPVSVAWFDSDFRRGTIDAFHEQASEASPRSEAYASWGALAMKECVQDAVCSLWTEFCRRGLDYQEHDGMTRSEVSQVSDCRPYTSVSSTGGLECAHFRFGGHEMSAGVAECQPARLWLRHAQAA